MNRFLTMLAPAIGLGFMLYAASAHGNEGAGVYANPEPNTCNDGAYWITCININKIKALGKEEHKPAPPPPPPPPPPQTPPPPPPPPVSKPIVKPHAMYGYYRVKPCDTLSTIAQKIYGTQVYWPSIYDLNRRAIGRDPWILRVGMRLRYLVHLTPAERARARREFNYWTLKYKNRKRNPLCILHGKPVEVGGHAHKAAKTAKKAHEKAAKKAKKK